jgi:hypothetical protein
MTIFTIILVLVFVVGIPYLIYETFIDGWLDKLINDFTSEQDKPLEDQPGAAEPA